MNSAVNELDNLEKGFMISKDRDIDDPMMLYLGGFDIDHLFPYI